MTPNFLKRIWRRWFPKKETRPWPEIVREALEKEDWHDQEGREHCRRIYDALAEKGYFDDTRRTD